VPAELVAPSPTTTTTASNAIASVGRRFCRPICHPIGTHNTVLVARALVVTTGKSDGGGGGEFKPLSATDRAAAAVEIGSFHEGFGYVSALGKVRCPFRRLLFSADFVGYSVRTTWLFVRRLQAERVSQGGLSVHALR
jgi:hypothetical protein